MPNVRVYPNEPQKVILAVVSEGDTETLFFWGDPGAQWHKDIAEEMKKEGHAVLDILGGGKIQVMPEEKAARFWGKSDRYGALSIEILEPLLEAAFEGYGIVIEQPA